MRDSLKERLRLDAIINGIKNIDEKYIFYYDESNNFRKFLLTESGINAPLNHFSLGGLLKKQDSQPEATDLLKNLHLQKNIEEVKAKHIFTGNFPDILKSRNLKNLLTNINDSKYYIHISITNPLYYSVVDIVDSVIHSNPRFAKTHLDIKDFIYRALRNDKNMEFKLYEFGYPNIKDSDLKAFKRTISDPLIKLYKTCKTPRTRQEYKAFTDAFRESKALIFIQENENNILIDSLYIHYQHNTLIYSNSTHIFDEETTIEKEFSKLNSYDKQVQGDNYEFKNSKESIEIQISDVIASLFGKYYYFIDNHEANELKKVKENLTPDQKYCLDLLTKIINKSDNESKGFFYRVVSIGEQKKNGYFLHDKEIELDNYTSLK